MILSSMPAVKFTVCWCFWATLPGMPAWKTKYLDWKMEKYISESWKEKKAITGMVCMVAHDGFDAKLTRTRQCTDALKHGRIPFQIPLFYSTPIVSRMSVKRVKKLKAWTTAPLCGEWSNCIHPGRAAPCSAGLYGQQCCWNNRWSCHPDHLETASNLGVTTVW